MSELEPDRRYRLSDHERDDALERLRTALSEGRLDLDEHERRSDAALRAVDNTDLVPLFDDLPRALRPASVTATEEPTVPTKRRGEGEKPERKEKDQGVNVGGLLGWGGFLLLVWGVPSFMSGSFYPIAIFLGFFCLMVLGPLAGRLIAHRNRSREDPPGRIEE
ncbi:DUF1707 domain-containing protein [Nocardiopsis sp. MG754419]|uniref:DUF1707 SHOCT-like domain-containing protein n=1 Tax=Nocardiopsis sp. MG754419 TaxID=2259865 RepID=UPI001BA5D08E|nr:DUF1707 domain-containing protein [Nocardiopsis sp. MG754419]MBR8743153.1 DUF1707 domain-containing protein [Nocardiopsis sp. MG754419]